MSFFDSISSFFSKENSESSSGSDIEKDQFQLIHDFEKRLSGPGSDKKVGEVVRTFTTASAKQKKKLFVPTYLKLEKFLLESINGNSEKAKTKLRNKVKSRFPKLLRDKHFSIIFEKDEKQEVLLSRLFLLNVVTNVKDLIGDSGSSKIQDIKIFVESAPDEFKSQVSFDFDIRKPSNLLDWSKILRKLISYTFITLVDKIGKKSTIIRFEKEYQKLAELYSDLESFQVVVSLLPDEILDESKLGTLNKDQIERLLQKKADYFERLTDQLAAKNKELEETQQKLIEAKENAELASSTKAMFLANMSHEIRTPMNAVIGMTDILRETKLTKEQLNYVDTIAKSGNDLITIINDILDYSKIESGNLTISEQTVDLYELVEEVIYMLALKAHEKSLEILYQIDEDVPALIKGDPVRLKQVLVNLINNAVKFTHQGFVKIRVSVEKKQNRKGTITFIIEDTGIGIEKSQLENIFSSFTQVDLSSTKKFEGTGLGLTISRTLIGLMGGSIDVDSAPGKGSTFSFSIDTEFEPDLNEDKRNPDFGSKKVGFATHSAVLINNFEKLSRSWNLDCMTFQDSISLEKSIDQNEKFELLLLDHNFLQYCEDKTLQKIESLQKQNVPAILIYPLGANIDRKFLDQFQNRVTKPLKRSELISELKSFLLGKPEDPDIKEMRSESKESLLSILVVEDNLTNQIVIKSLLTKLGYNPKFANNGAEALEQMNSETFELIFMDMQMPVLDGVETTTEIRTKNEAYSEPVIIALTANAMQEDREKCMEAGMDDFLSKPVKKDEILNTINKWFPNQ